MLPHLQDHIAEHVDSVSTYMLLYHEVTITNLIEVRLSLEGERPCVCCMWGINLKTGVGIA